jgi:hypothetical protein
MIWFITGMRTSLDDLGDLDSEKKIANGPNFLSKAHQNLQGRISLGKTTCSNASGSPS